MGSGCSFLPGEGTAVDCSGPLWAFKNACGFGGIGGHKIQSAIDLCGNVGRMKRIEIADLTRAMSASEPQYSPDGRYLAFKVTEADLGENEYKHHLWAEARLTTRQYVRRLLWVHAKTKGT